MVEIHTIFMISHTLLASAGMCFNVLLIYLALFKTPLVIRSYSTLIINFALSDFLACFFDFFVQQRIIPAGISLGYVSNGPCQYFGHTTCYVGYSLMLHSLSHTLWSLLLSFSYRYYVLFKPAPKRSTLMIIILLVYIPSFFQWISFLWAQDDPAEMVETLQTRFPSYNFTGYLVTGTKDILCFSALFTILHMTLPISPVYTCILIIRRNIIRRLVDKGARRLSSGTKNLHTQLLMALTYQAAIPGLYLFAVISYSLGQLGIYNHPNLEYFTFSSTLLIPVLSPWASFIFVKTYRRWILRKMLRKNYTEDRLTKTAISISVVNC